MQTIKIIIFTLCILMVLYSIIKKNRIYFNYGYLISGLLIIFDQISIYIENLDPINIAIACLWFVQVVLVIPNRLPQLTKDGSIVAKSAVPKIMISLSIINFFGAFYASQVDYIPLTAVCGHIILGLLPIFPAYFILAGKIETID